VNMVLYIYNLNDLKYMYSEKVGACWDFLIDILILCKLDREVLVSLLMRGLKSGVHLYEDMVI
jgi:hypothetical protein